MENEELPGTEQPGSGSGSASGSGAAHGGSETGTGDAAQLFDHEKLEVYRVARDFVVLTNGLLRKLPRELRDQFDRASSSILFNIGEGAGKTAKGDKQRFYEIARGSATEVATQLDLIQIRGFMMAVEYQQARQLLLRVSQMLSRMCGSPRRL